MNITTVGGGSHSRGSRIIWAAFERRLCRRNLVPGGGLGGGRRGTFRLNFGADLLYAWLDPRIRYR